MPPASPETSFAPPLPYATAISDWTKSIRRAPLWANLAVEDLRDRYRRTMFGLLWVVISFALFIAVKVFIFGQLTAVPMAEFGLFVSIGFGLWTFINAVVMDGCSAYMHARPWILGTSTPYPIFILQAIFRNWLTFMLTMAVMAIALIWRTTPWSFSMLWALPALAVYLVTALWLSAILAPLCIRHRDLHHAMQTVMRLVFFATPILWMPSTNARLAAIAQWNPIAHYIAIARDPLMYNTVPMDSWAVVLALNLVGLPLGLYVYTRTRSSLIFWL